MIFRLRREWTMPMAVCGFLPLHFGDGEMWEPMAVAIIAGLLFATVLTLGFVPVLSSILFRVLFKGYAWRGDPASGWETAGSS
jgi:hypothetical protein